jgi:hypothetical protein
VVFHNDNVAAVASINSGSTNHRTAQALKRRLWALAVMGGYTYTAVWLASADSGLDDALSRFEWDRSKRFNEQATTQLVPAGPTAPPFFRTKA